MRRLTTAVSGWPVLGRFAVLAGVGAAILGGLTGLVVGLIVNPPTAWFAVIEVGVPAAVAGALGGLLVGCGYLGARRLGLRSPR